MTALKHPSSFTLERLSLGALSGAEQSSISAHVALCAQCRARLEAMEQQAASFSRSSHSSPARQRVVRADQAWRRNAMRAVLLPAAAIVAVLVAAPWKDSTPVVDRPSPRQGRSPVELRPGTARPTLKTLSFRGQQVAFGQGTLEAAEDEGASRPFVLEHTDVVAEVTGFVSAVTVTQRFKNPFEKPVEAVYVFPLPENAAVDEMTLTAGTRVIRATIQKREEARRQYEQAKAQGRRAALLDQERPNIFTQSVANLLPGESVQVSLRYVAPLRFDDGAYTFNFPMVVGPRYMPGAPLAGASQGTGTMPDTDRVDDASRLSPPIQRTGRDISVEVRLETGAVIEELWSVSHQLQSERTSSSRAVITLDAADRVPNKDFILRWKVSGPETRAAVVSTGGPEGTFALMLNPEAQPSNEEVLPKEMVFVIDTSCSMGGAPLDAAKQAMALAMKQMNPRDSFMLIDFADTASSFHDSPLPNTPENVKKALRYLGALPSGGGTNQLAGIRRALDRPADSDRLRVVLLMTDGFIGNEQEIFQETQRLLGNGRVFGFGIGESVNHFLLARLSEEGRGFYQYVRTDEDPTEAVSRFVRRIAKPLMTDVTIDWGGLQVVDVLPRKVPDLFDAQPVVLLGRYRNGGPAAITLRGRMGSKNVELVTRVNLGVASAASSGLTSMWARARIEEVDRLQKFGQFPEAVKEITTLGLEHHLVTPYTSFVAVDSEPVTSGESTQVVVPTDTEEHGGPPLTARRFNTIQVIRGSAEPEPPPAPATTIPLITPPRPDPTTTKEPERLHGESAGGDTFDDLFGDTKKDEGRFNPDPAPTNQTKQSLDQSDILEGVMAARSQLQACFAEQRRLQPSVTSGKVVMKWTIGTDGRVKSVSVVPGDFANSPFAACLKRVISKLVFPPHSIAGEPVQFPFKF